MTKNSKWRLYIFQIAGTTAERRKKSKKSKNTRYLKKEKNRL